MPVCRPPWRAGFKAIVALACVSAVAPAKASFPAVISVGELSGSNGFTLKGIDRGDYAGVSVGGGGDINGDGVDDILIGATGADPRNKEGAGEGYVVYGARVQFPGAISIGLFLNGRDGFVINGPEVGDGSGSTISFVGDFNQDGLDDLVVGSPGADPMNRDSAGTSHVVFGRTNGFPSRLELGGLPLGAGITLQGAGQFHAVGRTLGSAGDVNGDGIDDLVIGVPTADTEALSSAGKTYVVFGRTDNSQSTVDLAGLDGHNGFVITGASEDDFSGHAVASAGDFNGDGIGDFVIGAPKAAFPGRLTAGASYLVYGRSDGFPPALDLNELTNEQGVLLVGIHGNSGYAVSSAGDVNGDGFGDIVIGSDFAPGDANFAGEAYVLFGTADRFVSPFYLGSLDGVAGFRMTGEKSLDLSGRIVASAGDLNADGFDDIVIGSPNAGPDRRTDPGKAYVVFGQEGNFPATLNLGDLNGTNGFALVGMTPGDRLGDAVGSAGDFNGDGISDLIVGAPGTLLGTGAVYIVFGQRAVPEPSSIVVVAATIALFSIVSRRRPGAMLTPGRV